MSGLNDLFQRFVGGDIASTEAVGLLVALALVIALRVLVATDARKVLRQPYLLLGLHLLTLVVLALSPDGGTARKFLAPTSLLLLLLAIGRAAVLLVVDVLVGGRLGKPLPKITRDIVQGLVYATIAVATLRAFGVEAGQILTTSALLTAVIGLSLQETLGNLFAGLAIQAQRPFDVDDWIQFDADPKHIGRVIEINWRATKVITLDEVEVIVPNGALAKSPIVNFTKPTLVSRRSIYVHAPYSVPPAKVQEVILAAIKGANGVVEEPKPSVVTNQFFDKGVEYWVRFFTDRFHQRDGVDGGVRDRIWYAMHRAGIPIPVPAQTLEIREVSDETLESAERKKLDERMLALRCVDFFRVLEEDQLRLLAERTHHRLFAPGESIVHQGDAGSELFVIEQGEVSVTHHRDGGGSEAEVARLGAGKFFGEMALMTGDVRHATVRARTHCKLLEVPQDALKPVLDGSPALAERISEVLAHRQAQLDARREATKAPDEKEMRERTDALLGKIRRLFAL